MNNWEKGIEELQKKRENLAIAGGLDRIAKQHASGKLTARERIDVGVDEVGEAHGLEVRICRISGFYGRGRLAWGSPGHEDLPRHG